MTDGHPLITIAITCYNAEGSIIAAIDSAALQDWPHTEIIIVDDLSTDASVEKIHARIATLPHARLIVNEKNIGPGGTRQKLLEEAKGEYIAFFDDDDISLPARIRVQWETIERHAQKIGQKNIACYASGSRLYPNGYEKQLPAIGSEDIVPQGDGMAESILYYGRRKNWFYGSGTPTCSLMARTELLRAAGGFDPAFRRVEDLDLTIRLSQMDCAFIGTTEKLFIQHATESADKSGRKNLDAELQLANKYRDFLNARSMFFYARTWPKLRHYHFAKNYPAFFLTLLLLLLRHPIKTISQLLDTGPKRLRHEKKMRT
jgi:glycosyltransferase involved in cell wall biosynthesis